MEYQSKTLVLIDNSASTSMGNRKIAIETLKYLFRNAPVGESFALATYSGQTELLVDYDREIADYLDAVERIAYTEKETCLSDVVMRTVEEWEKADYAMRNILVITDGLGRESGVYPIEEVYFKLNEADYPLYAILLVQETNEAALNRVASMARISHGAAFFSEFEGSDAEVERQLGERVFAKMEEKKTAAGVRSEATESGTESEFETAAEENRDAAFAQGAPMQGSDDTVTEYDSEMYYARVQQEGNVRTLQRDEVLSACRPLFLILGVMVFATAVILLLGKYSKRSQKRAEPVQRLLPEKSLTEITLEDLNNPMQYFRLPPMEKIVLGSSREDADVALDYDDEIAGKQCEISLHCGKYYLRELSGKCSTYLNGQRVFQETELHSSDVISVGRAKLLIRMQNYTV